MRLVRSAGATSFGSEAAQLVALAAGLDVRAELPDPDLASSPSSSSVRAAAGRSASRAVCDLLPQPLLAEVELAEVGQPLGLPLGDLVEHLLHPAVNFTSTSWGKCSSRSAVTAKAVKVGTSAWPCFTT